jgi:sulfur carrier protein ThiS
MTIHVLFVPAGNTKTVQVTQGTTVQDVVSHLQIDSTYKILLGGETEVAPSEFSTTCVDGVEEIWAVQGSKGAF